MKIDKYKIKVNNFSAELEKPLDRSLRSFITIEADIYEVATQDNQDGTFNEVYKAKLVGSTIIKQEGQKSVIKGKSKRSQSQKLKIAFWKENPDEEFYDIYTDKIINNLPEVIEFVKDK